MVAALAAGAHEPMQCTDLLAHPGEPLFDLAGQGAGPGPRELALWSGLRLSALPQPAGDAASAAGSAPGCVNWKPP